MSEISGKVYLVGAGPGDPGLLTLRGRELLARAHVVVYDTLVNESILQYAPNAEQIFVGKRTDQHPLAQEDINRLLIEQSAHGDCVVRLKGGDPFVFGRGGEEAAALAAAGIPFEVVPGVTAGVGAAAYAGIPITQRGMSDSVTFVMGHGKGTSAPEFDRLPTSGTLVFYMGVESLAANMEVLRKSGRADATPVAVIEWGTLARQRTITGTLGNIAARSEAAAIEAPAIVVVGEVVSLRETLTWFENRPLFGKRVVVTRTRKRAGELVQLLRERGADVFEFSTVEIEATPDLVSLRPLSEYDWILLTSINGVDALFDTMAAAGQDARDLHGVKLCAISAKTAEALEQRCLRIDALPERYETDDVIRKLEDVGGVIKGKRVLMPRADIGRSSLPEALRKEGAEVDELQSYRTVVPKDLDSLATELLDYAPHYVTFGSAAAVRNFHEVLGPDRLLKLSNNTRYAAIGPIAATAARELDLNVTIVPDVHRIPDLVDAIVDFDASIQNG